MWVQLGPESCFKPNCLFTGGIIRVQEWQAMGLVGGRWEVLCYVWVLARLLQPGDSSRIYSVKRLNFLCWLVIETNVLICLFMLLKKKWWKGSHIGRGIKALRKASEDSTLEQSVNACVVSAVASNPLAWLRLPRQRERRQGKDYTGIGQWWAGEGDWLVPMGWQHQIPSWCRRSFYYTFQPTSLRSQGWLIKDRHWALQ